jgi:hypothetical protein
VAWGVERLPQLDLVAVRVIDPGEAPVALVLAIRVDAHAAGLQALEQRVEVVDDVVHHELGRARLEVRRVAGENAPDRHVLGVRVVLLPPGQHERVHGLRRRRPARMEAAPAGLYLRPRGVVGRADRDAVDERPRLDA